MFILEALDVEGACVTSRKFDDLQEAVIKGQKFIGEENPSSIRFAYVLEQRISLTSTGLISIVTQHRWFGAREKEPEKEEPKTVYVLKSIDLKTGDSRVAGVLTDEGRAEAWVLGQTDSSGFARVYVTCQLEKVLT